MHNAYLVFMKTKSLLVTEYTLTYIHNYVAIMSINFVHLQWDPSCEATLFATEMWHFKRSGLSSGGRN